MPYKQFWKAFKNHVNPLFITVTAFLMNYFLIVNIIIIYKKYSFIIEFVSKKRKILKYKGK